MNSTPNRIGIRSLSYVMVFVRDMQRSLAFYRDSLGLTAKATSPHWCEFDMGAVTLALHAMEPGASPARPASADPGARKDVPIEIVFGVDDPLRSRAAAVASGLNVAAPKMVFEAGPQVGVSCLLEDPDGNLLSLFGMVSREAFARAQG